MHRLELLESLIHMLAGFATQCYLKLTKCISKLYLISTDEFRTLLTVKHEVELWDGLHLEG